MKIFTLIIVWIKLMSGVAYGQPAWNCYKKMDSKLSQIMQPVLGFLLSGSPFLPVFGSPA